MVGSSGTNPHTSTAKSGKRKGKQVQFVEEPTSSKRQRVGEEDDMSVYREDPLEPISPAFDQRNPYLTNGIYVDLEILQNLGYDLTEHLGPYMNWLGIQNEYNVGVLRVFYQSLAARVKRREKGDKSLVAHVRFFATIRGRSIEFDWKIINQLLGITDPNLNKWKYHKRFSSDQLKDAYGTDGKKA